MTNAQRLASATNDQKVVWDGASSNRGRAQIPRTDANLRISAPASLAKTYQINTAGFGPRSPSQGSTEHRRDTANRRMRAITNGGAISGRIALIDRGNCTFVDKSEQCAVRGSDSGDHRQ